MISHLSTFKNPDDVYYLVKAHKTYFWMRINECILLWNLLLRTSPWMVPYYCLTPIIQVTMCCCRSVNLKSWTKSVKSFLFFCKLAKTFSSRGKKISWKQYIKKPLFHHKGRELFLFNNFCQQPGNIFQFWFALFFKTALIKYRHLTCKIEYFNLLTRGRE